MFIRVSSEHGKGGAVQSTDSSSWLSSLLFSANKKPQQSHIQPCLQGLQGYHELKGHRFTSSLLQGVLCLVSKSRQTRHVNIYGGHFRKSHWWMVQRKKSWVSVLQSSTQLIWWLPPLTILQLWFLLWLGAGSPLGLELWQMDCFLCHASYPPLDGAWPSNSLKKSSCGQKWMEVSQRQINIDIVFLLFKTTSNAKHVWLPSLVPPVSC